MPLKAGSSKSTISSNIEEFHSGNTYSKTSKKFGKAKADKQAIAVALSKARESGKLAKRPSVKSQIITKVASKM